MPFFQLLRQSHRFLSVARYGANGFLGWLRQCLPTHTLLFQGTVLLPHGRWTLTSLPLNLSCLSNMLLTNVARMAGSEMALSLLPNSLERSATMLRGQAGRSVQAERHPSWQRQLSLAWRRLPSQPGDRRPRLSVPPLVTCVFPAEGPEVMKQRQVTIAEPH